MRGVVLDSVHSIMIGAVCYKCNKLHVRSLQTLEVDALLRLQGATVEVIFVFRPPDAILS